MLIKLSGLIFEVRPRFEICKKRFWEFHTTEGVPLEIVEASDEDMQKVMKYCSEDSDPGYVENMAYCSLFSEILLKYKRCIFHGAAFSINDNAYLFCGPSGVGKSTQIVLWRFLYQNQVNIINGDKPVLQFMDDETIIVHPSPWRGKENCGYAPAAPLKGIVLLKQEKENRIYPVTKRDAILPLYYQFICGEYQEEQIHRMSRMLENILNSVKIWRLENKGDMDSAKLCHEVLVGGNDVKD